MAAEGVVVKGVTIEGVTVEGGAVKGGAVTCDITCLAGLSLGGGGLGSFTGWVGEVLNSVTRAVV